MIEKGYLGRALRIVSGDPWTYLAGGLVLHALAASTLGLLVGPAICGIVWVTLKHCRAQEVTFADLFRGFEIFGASFGAGLLFCLMVGAGLVFFVVPGIIVGALFCFVFPFLVDHRLSLQEAMEASRNLAAGERDLLDRSLFFLLALLVGLSGTVLAVAGLLFTWPLMWAAVAVAYEDLAAPGRPS